LQRLVVCDESNDIKVPKILIDLRDSLMSMHDIKNESGEWTEKEIIANHRRDLYNIEGVPEIFRRYFFCELLLLLNINPDNTDYPEGFSGCFKIVFNGLSSRQFVLTDCKNDINPNAVVDCLNNKDYICNVIFKKDIVFNEIKTTKISDSSCKTIATLFVNCLCKRKNEAYYIKCDTGIIQKLCQFFSNRKYINGILTNNRFDIDKKIEEISKLIFKLNYKNNIIKLNDFYTCMIIVSYCIEGEQNRENFQDSVSSSFNEDDKGTLSGFETYIC
jgi:hypothetical protein